MNVTKINELNHKNILFIKDLINDSFVRYSFGNTFCAFQSITNNNLFYIIYSTKTNSIISYNLITNQKLTEIKYAHNKTITNFNYYSDKNNKRDLFLSISAEDNTIKIWNTYNFTCITNLPNVNNSGFILSSCFLYDNKTDNIYIITSNRNWGNNKTEKIKIYDLNGHKIKEIKNSNNNTFFINTYYDSKLYQKYIITGNDLGNSYSYNFDKNKRYKKYSANSNSFIKSIVINDKSEVVKLIESIDGFVMVLNFHNSDLLNKIKIGEDYICGICIWNDNFLVIGSYDRKIVVLDLNKKIIVDTLFKHKHSVITVQKIIYNKYGECLLSQGLANDQIRLVVFK